MGISVGYGLTLLSHVVHAVGHRRVLLSGVQEVEPGVVIDEMIVWRKKSEENYAKWK